jgi:ankyrin repeat protein
MAPSQRGLGVMMKRGRKGVTARPNGAGVHINIEHVDVISCEHRQLASEVVPMRKAAGLAEAPPGSPWLEALDSMDCKQLMNLLQENPCRVVEKSKAGFTVVHAAAMQGCLKLLDQVFDLLKDNDRFVDEEEGIEVSLQELLKAEIDWEFGENGRLTAFELAWWSMGDYECQHYLLNWERRSGTFLSYQSKIFGSSIDPEVDDEESPSTRALLLGVLADHRSLLSESMRSEFEEDLKYNFVADCEELRFHHACEWYIYDSNYKEYIKAVIGGCVEKGPHVLKYLFQLRNAQGKTPLHLARMTDFRDLLVHLIPGGESGQENAECLNMPDSRGWTALHCASAQDNFNYLNVLLKASAQDNFNYLNVLLKDRRVDVNATVKSMLGTGWYCTGATPLHVAVINNNSKAVKRLLQDPRTDVNALFRRRIYFDDSLYVNRFYDDLVNWTPLQLAAAAALPEMVKMLIKRPKVCICSQFNPSMTMDTFSLATNFKHSISL